LCNSAIVFDRRVGARTLTFGTTGKLRNSDLVMWDRQTQSWWQQFTGTALVGAETDARLRALDSQVLSWTQFKATYPHGTVLSRNTGFQRPYESNPYQGYDTVPTSRPQFYRGRVDPRLPPLERVEAVFAGRQAAVVPFSALARHPVVRGSIAGRPLVVLYTPGVVSALDASAIASSRDVGTAGAFDPRVGNRTLRFWATGAGRFRDQTGSTWDVTGRALDGPLRGAQLRPLRHDEQFWFALAAFLPGARLLAVGSGRDQNRVVACSTQRLRSIIWLGSALRVEDRTARIDMHIFEGMCKFSPPRGHPRPRLLSDYLAESSTAELGSRSCRRARRSGDVRDELSSYRS